MPSIEVSDPIRLPNENYKQRPITVKGEHFIWIYCCNWRISINDQKLSHNESTDAQIANAVDFLDGQVINEIKIDSEKLTMTFTFDLGGQLLIWNNEAYESDTNLIMISSGNKWLTLNNLKELELSVNEKIIAKTKIDQQLTIKN